jgi:hypothetical protein
MLARRLLQTLVAVATWHATSEAQFNNPSGVDIWCGKAYRATFVFPNTLEA